MRFSVLLPTRERLELLRDAVETVRRQPGGDWEIVIADNASEADVAGYVESLDDPRVRYLRSDTLLDVTANWNRALDASRGEYILMLGDDDGLTPAYFDAVDQVLRGHGDPDVLYTRAWLFAYPGVMPFEPRGYYHVAGCAPFFRGKDAPFVVDRAERRRHVREAMGFHQTIDFNMQYLLVSRRLVNRLAPRGPFFQSAFPDYFATPAVFWMADVVVADPTPRTIIGVTPRSYGFYHFNRRDDEGADMLYGDSTVGAASAGRVPGSGLNDGWLSAMDTLASVYGDEIDASVDVSRYRLLQALALCERRWLDGEDVDAAWRIMEGRIGRRERALFRLLWAAYASRRIPSHRWRTRFDGLRLRARRALRQHPEVFANRTVGQHADLLSFYSALERGLVDMVNHHPRAAR